MTKKEITRLYQFVERYGAGVRNTRFECRFNGYLILFKEQSTRSGQAGYDNSNNLVYSPYIDITSVDPLKFEKPVNLRYVQVVKLWITPLNPDLGTKYF